MSGMNCKGCGHTKSWHAGTTTRFACKYPGCTCAVYATDAAQAVHNPKPNAPAFSTASASPARDVISHGSAEAAEFMLGLAARCIGSNRLNTMSETAAIAVAKMAPGWCRKCKGLVYMRESSPDYRSMVGTSAWGAFVSPLHISSEHVAEIFHVDAKELHKAALEYITGRVRVDHSDEEEEEPEELGILVGWRSWNLTITRDGLCQLMAPHHYNINDKPVVTNLVEATHSGNRQLCLTHMARERTDGQVNPVTLEVTVDRDKCTCGIYCYLDWDAFCLQGYRVQAQVTSNVVPWGTVQVGADGQTARASDMMISRLVLYVGITQLDGAAFRAIRPDINHAWGRYLTGIPDLQMLAYRGLGQQLANQFECQVDLAEPCTDFGGDKATTPISVIETLMPQQNILPDWLKEGLKA